MKPDDSARLPRTSIRRTVEWPDTDAAGHYHHSTILRWFEAAEAELYAGLGIVDLFGVIPRVHLEVRHRARLWFRDEVEIEIRVEQVGRTSVTYAFSVVGQDAVAAEGTLTAVHIDPVVGRSLPWPDHVKRALTCS